MIGIDPGLNIGSVYTVNSEGNPGLWNILVFDKEKKAAPLLRLWRIAERFAYELPELFTGDVAIEEPFYAHGKSNPRSVAHVHMMYGILTYLLNQRGFTIHIVHNRTVKKLAGYKQGGKNTKDQMIQAYKNRVGSLPPHKTKYGQETLADSYFIALAGLEALKKK